MFGGQVRNTDGAIFSTGEAFAPPVKQLKNALIRRHKTVNVLRVHRVLPSSEP